GGGRTADVDRLAGDVVGHHGALGPRLQQSACRQAQQQGRETGFHAATARLRLALRGSVTRKWPPLVSVTTLMRPPCASVNSRAMARPRPVPSTRPLACAWPRKNESKIDSRSSGGTPGPVSTTSMIASPPLAPAHTAIVPPPGVNLTALP